MHYLTSLIFCVVLFTVCFASVDENLGKCCKCTTVTPVSNFNLQQFSTKWYVIVKSHPALHKKLKCISSKVSAINATQANYSRYDQNIWSNKPENVSTLMYRKYDKIPGILAVGPKDSEFAKMSNYTVLEIDYKKYAVVHSCTRINHREFESAYIVSPQPSLDEKTVREGKKKLKSFGFNTDHFAAVDQLNCD